MFIHCSELDTEAKQKMFLKAVKYLTGKSLKLPKAKKKYYVVVTFEKEIGFKNYTLYKILNVDTYKYGCITKQVSLFNTMYCWPFMAQNFKLTKLMNYVSNKIDKQIMDLTKLQSSMTAALYEGGIHEVHN